MEIKEIWKVFKMSNMQDEDMQKMFRRHATPNECIKLLEEIDLLHSYILKLEDDITLAKSFYSEKGFIAGATKASGLKVFGGVIAIKAEAESYANHIEGSIDMVREIEASAIEEFSRKIKKSNRPVTYESVIKSMNEFASRKRSKANR